MKLLLLYTYNKGYLSSFFFELSKKLQSEGFSVVNYALKQKAQSFVQDNVTVRIGQKGGYLANYYNIFNVIRSEKPDFILSNFSYVNPALLFGKILGVKKNIVWFHSLQKQMTPTWCNVFVKKQFLKLADLVIANSYFTEKELQEIYNLGKDHVTVLPFWTDIAERKAENSSLELTQEVGVLKIGCPGRMARHKNQEVVIEAVALLKASYGGKFKLYFAGDGPEFSNLTRLVKQYDLQQEVLFLRHLSADDMASFYAQMDVIVLPSLHEAFGLVFIEALALGAPVIVSSQFGALTFLDTEKDAISQITFDPNSKTELAERLGAYINNEGLPKSYFKQLYFRNFDKAIIFEHIAALFR